MLRIKGLVKSFGNFRALDGVDMEIFDGALFGFVGPNGAGKTTTIKIMTGLLAPDSGSVEVNGVDAVVDRRHLKSQIGYVPDSFGTYDNLKVSEYLEFFASCYGMEGLAARKRYMDLLERVGLEDKAGFYVDGLSGGMKQRLCLARALLHDPSLLIMDEPASGLDPRTRFEFKEIIKELREGGKTIFISSHILSELSEMCTDIGIIEQGKMILRGSMEEILNRVNVSNPLIISVYRNMDTAIRILKSHPCVQTISMRLQSIMVGFIGDKQDEALLLQQLVDADVLVNGFMREQGNLESLFMQITDHQDEKAVLIHES